MKKKLLVLGIGSLLLCGCGKVPTLSNGDEAVVSFKGDKKISANEFYEEIKNSYGLNTLVTMIDKYIYETEFKDKLDEAKEYTASYKKQLMTNYKSEEELLQALQTYYGFQTIEAFENSIYLSYLQGKATEKYVQEQLTDKELKDYYENNVYPDMTISHILITADITDDMADDKKKEAEDKAKKEINNIIKELNNAKNKKQDIKKTFENLAKKHSEDDSTKNKGGNLGEINVGSFDNKYDELIKSAAKLKDGEYSTELITTELGYHVILKTGTGKKKSYDDSLTKMKEDLAKEKISKDSSLSTKSAKHYREKYDMNIIDSEIKSQYGKYMNSLINSNTNQTTD